VLLIQFKKTEVGALLGQGWSRNNFSKVNAEKSVFLIKHSRVTIK